MSAGSFSLRPFPGTVRREGIEIRGRIGRRHDILSISYELTGEVSSIDIPAPAGVPARKRGLWERTCFELFLAPRTSQGYWEFNFSPAGDWNVFRFDSYRSGMRPEEAFSSLSISAREAQGRFSLSVEFDAACIVPPDRPLDAGISAVILRKSGEAEYWALAHPGPKPDFHDRKGFSVELPPLASS